MRLEKTVNIVKDALKKEFIKDPVGIWKYPCIAILTKNKELKIIDGKYDEARLAEWLRYNLNLMDINVIVVGRMLLKTSNIIDPTTNMPVVEKKEIVVFGKDIKTNERLVVRIPCKYHIDLRNPTQIEKDTYGNFLVEATFGGSPDISKFITHKNKQIFYRARFGEEIVLSSKKGDIIDDDPLIKMIIGPKEDKNEKEVENEGK